MRICHASIDENGNIKGGQPGEQKKEVCVRSWYNKPWNVLLRHPNKEIGKKAADLSVFLSDCNIGYNQDRRNTAHDILKSYNYDVHKLKESNVACDTDCSAFVTLAYICAGIKTLEYNGNAPTTRTMRKVFSAAGFEVITQSKYLTSTKYLQKGDILLSEGHHTVICIDDGEMLVNGANASYFKPYEGTTDSIVTALGSIGADYTKAYRKKIYEANGLDGTYTGTATQNIRLLELLKQGKLKKP